MDYASGNLAHMCQQGCSLQVAGFQCLCLGARIADQLALLAWREILQKSFNKANQGINPLVLNCRTPGINRGSRLVYC